MEKTILVREMTEDCPVRISFVVEGEPNVIPTGTFIVEAESGLCTYCADLGETIQTLIRLQKLDLEYFGLDRPYPFIG